MSIKKPSEDVYKWIFQISITVQNPELFLLYARVVQGIAQFG